MQTVSGGQNVQIKNLVRSWDLDAIARAAGRRVIHKYGETLRRLAES